VAARVARPAGLARTQLWKRALDLAIALPLLVFVSPLLLALAVAVRLQDGGPALFRQERVGLGGRDFVCLKFRTMVVDAPARLRLLLEQDPAAAKEWRERRKLSNDPRVSRLGRFLRRSSLDELPQLFNIIRGEMSVVGPRPISREELPRYGDLVAVYMSAPPGVTGLWQVSGRNDLPYEARVVLDAAYVKNCSLRLDLWILLRTIPAVLFSKGAY
jgi:exopolysaccharide production protein ExoY